MTDLVERLRSHHSDLCGDDYWTEIFRERKEAADEIMRLRAALESLTKDPPATLDEPDPDSEVIKKMRAIARAALSLKDPLDRLAEHRRLHSGIASLTTETMTAQPENQNTTPS